MTSRFLITGQDVVKLSKADSSEHRLSVRLFTVEEDTTEDRRPQLLQHEPMRLTPLTTEPEGARTKEVVMFKDEVQTEKEPPQPSAMEQVIMRIDGNFTEMNTQTSEALQTIYNQQ